MKLFHDLQNGQPGGETGPVPAFLQRFVSSWSKPEYRKYEFGHTLVQEFVSRKFSVYSWHFLLELPTRFFQVCTQPVMVLQFALRGEIVLSMTGLGDVTVKQSGCTLLYQPEAAATCWFDAGRYEFLFVEIDPVWLEDIVDAYPAVTHLLTKFNKADKQAESLITANINYVMRAILKSLRLTTSTTGLLKMEMQKYIPELLSEYVYETREVEKDLALGYVPNRDILITIKQLIMESPNIHAQTQEKLSAKYGISLTTLKQNFKILFGVPLARFVRFHALSRAHYLIATTRQSIDDISEEVGYSNRTAFNQAFKRQFRYLPSGVRENPEQPGRIQQE